MMDNAMFKANMKNTENDICNMPTQEPGIHDLLVRLGEIAKDNQCLSYQIRENLFGPIPIESNSCESTINCAKDALESAIAQLAETNDILCYVRDHL